MKKLIVGFAGIFMAFSFQDITAANESRRAKRLRLENTLGEIPERCPGGVHPYPSACQCYENPEELEVFFRRYPQVKYDSVGESFKRKEAKEGAQLSKLCPTLDVVTKGNEEAFPEFGVISQPNMLGGVVFDSSFGTRPTVSMLSLGVDFDQLGDLYKQAYLLDLERNEAMVQNVYDQVLDRFGDTIFDIFTELLEEEFETIEKGIEVLKCKVAESARAGEDLVSIDLAVDDQPITFSDSSMMPMFTMMPQQKTRQERIKEVACACACAAGKALDGFDAEQKQAFAQLQDMGVIDEETAALVLDSLL